MSLERKLRKNWRIIGKNSHSVQKEKFYFWKFLSGNFMLITIVPLWPPPSKSILWGGEPSGTQFPKSPEKFMSWTMAVLFDNPSIDVLDLKTFLDIHVYFSNINKICTFFTFLSINLICIKVSRWCSDFSDKLFFKSPVLFLPTIWMSFIQQNKYFL